MTQCAKIIVGFMANVGNVFYPTFTNVFFIFSTFFTFFNVFFLIFISTFISSMGWRAHLDDRSCDVFVLHDGRRVGGTVGEARRVVVDVLDLDDDGAVTTATRAAVTAAAVVRDDHLEPVRHARLLDRPDQRYDTGRRRDAERTRVQLVVCIAYVPNITVTNTPFTR